MDRSLLLGLTLVSAFAIGGAVGAIVAYLYAKASLSKLEAKQAADRGKLDWVRAAQQSLRDTFQALASQSLPENTADFAGRIQQQLGSHASRMSGLSRPANVLIDLADGCLEAQTTGI